MTLPDGVPLAALCLACAAAAWLDLRHRRIPNWLCVLTALAGLAITLVTAGPSALGSHALHLVLALLGGMVLFRIGAFGGGDAKFYAAIAAWFGLDQAAMLLIAVSLSGLVLFMGWFTVRRLAGKPVRVKGGTTFDSMPYGIAIGLGAIITMLV